MNPHEAVQLLAFCMGDVLKPRDATAAESREAAAGGGLGLAGIAQGLDSVVSNVQVP